MISVPGKINIRSVPGRFGSFNVGTLDCSIGSFTVKDATIEEFEEGVYEGDFVIEKIKPNSYFSSGRMVGEVRATLSAIVIAKHAGPSPVQHESLEQDPLVEDFNQVFSSLEPEPMPLPIPYPLDPQGDADEEGFLFSGPLGSVVKLDPTIDRGLFRQQKEYLKSVGYKFDAGNQTWKKGV